ncbi:hypothetical protein PSA7680_02185 [Pseudoruegeria aquimaris]|uniref:DUF6455 domain-containing protein n=1 Tax=Pseudoruegeria aquimaris TaxID=393663 RepID=A0A1Y5SL98_9RHOB|nr:DUF6455 family protein [Pseudoruegeria aquimaris]SLN43452.1 hypothetical protein PSA7680_02185 [Pseudoruegeria aquimaris]
MKPLGEERRHYWLAKRMADAAQADVVGAFSEGRLSSQEWAGLVTRCRGCTWVEGCARWLEEDHPEAIAPAACANARVFEALKLPS